MSHRRPSLPRLMTALALGLLGMARAAEFTNSFDDVVGGAALTVLWDGIPKEAYPLSLTGQVIEMTGDRNGQNVNQFRANVSYIPTGNTFKWENAPYPLRYVPGGIYRLELRSSTWAGEGIAPVLAKSPTFSMREQTITKTNGGGGGGGTAPTVIDYQSSGSSGVNRPLAIGLGVAIGIPSVVALGILSWCYRRKQRRAALEKRRKRRLDFVIT